MAQKITIWTIVGVFVASSVLVAVAEIIDI
jgi:hypothetical protein